MYFVNIFSLNFIVRITLSWTYVWCECVQFIPWWVDSILRRSQSWILL